MKKVFLFLICCFFSIDAYAKIDYAVTVPVDIEAANSVEAKDKGMLEAQRKAFLEAAGMLISEENKAKLNDLTDEAIMYFVQSVSVTNEKAGGTKYKADLTVQINERLLKDYLAENEMIQGENEEMTVVPVLKPYNGSYPLLWEDNNLWMQSWRQKGLIKFGTMQMRTITDNYRNITELNAQNALYMTSELYDKIAEYSGSEQVYVVFAEVLENGDLKVTIKSEKTKSEDTFTVYNDNQDLVYDKAIEKSVMFISNMQRESQNLSDVVTINSINAVYVYQDMKDWLLKSRAIADLPQVEGVDTKSFGGGKVNFSIRYSGSLDDLWSAMQEMGLSHETKENYFIIR